MLNYQKKTSRLTVQLFDSETEKLILEVNNRDHLNIGDFLSQSTLTRLLDKHCSDNEIKNPPKEIDVLVGTKLFLK